MKVLHVVHFPIFGGPHNQALRLAGPLTVRGVESLVVVPDEPGNAVERLRQGGVDVRPMTLHRLRATMDPRAHIGLLAGLLPEIRRLREVIRRERIDIVQIGGLVNPHAAIAARLERVPVVWQLVDTRAPRLVAIAAMVGVRLLADVVMSTGTAVAEAQPGYAAIADRLVPFFPPVELDRFAPQPELRAKVRAAWGIPANASVVGCVANVNPQKGVLELVRIFTAVLARHPGTHLVLVGAEYATHAAYSAAVRAQMAIDGLVEGRDVLFVGARDDVERQLAGMDVIALAAAPRSEGITTAILEAMAAGLPAVVSDVGALREAVADGQTGFVISPGDSVAFTAALVRLLEDDALRAAMGEAARHVATERFGVDACADTHVRAYARALGTRGLANSLPTLDVVPRFACPVCRNALQPAVDGYPCLRCGHTYPVVDGIPILLRDGTLAKHDEIIDHHPGLDHAYGAAHKVKQLEHFDRAVTEEFEITRPHGAPRFYRFLLREKFRRGTTPIGADLVGASALTVCGGSGMDAEFLVRAGAQVVASDISLGAARRTQQRARRYDLRILPIVADIEHLPFADGAFDLVLVHDGLHHLERPDVGLAEMARVARRWVSVSEPARAAVTVAAIRVGLALEAEAAGNRVARMTADEVVSTLGEAGYKPARIERYAMLYRHEPGLVMRNLSRPVVYPMARLALGLVNRVVGRCGNKLVVVAEKREPTSK